MFIELTNKSNGNKILINTDHVMGVYPNQEWALLSFPTTTMNVVETYDEVKRKLELGGIYAI